MGAGDVALAQIAWAWDMHVLDAWIPLSQGATARLLREAERLDGARVATAIADCAPVWCQGTPTFWRGVLRAGWLGDGGARLLALTSGEPMAPELARKLLLRARGGLLNCYGLTEATIFQVTTCGRWWVVTETRVTFVLLGSLSIPPVPSFPTA